MSITNGYATYDAFKYRQLTVQAGGGYAADTTRDAVMHKMIEAASRWIDAQCFRKFYTTTETRYYTARYADWLKVDDLVSVTSIKTDDGSSRTYPTTWSATDYDLEPFDARNLTPALPYNMIRTTPQGLNYFPTFKKGIQIVGTWGFSDQTVALSTLSAGVNASVTTWPVTSGTSFEVGHIALCGSEQAFVDVVSGNNLTVRRGVNGTTAATHDSATAVSVYQFGAISEACILYSQRLFMRQKAVLGVTGTSITGQINMNIPVDKDIIALLDGYRRPGL